MLSGPTLYRLSVPVASTVVGTGGMIDVDTHVRLSGGQDLRPYVDAAFMERFSANLASLDQDIYQEFANSLIQVSMFMGSCSMLFDFFRAITRTLLLVSCPCTSICVLRS